jgi:predicted TIM-barrel fold metal-dependent hydrolase
MTVPEHDGVRDDRERIVVVSCDTHVGPTMEQLRPHCSSQHLEPFDGLARSIAAVMEETAGTLGTPWNGEFLEAMRDNNQRSREHDFDGRMDDLDADGIAGEVIFHGSQNIYPVPFSAPFADHGKIPQLEGPEVRLEGIRIYNRWLADFVSVQPERHAGLAHIPPWDPEACVEEVFWAKENGLRGINFPALRPYDPEVPLYNDPVWEPFWAACAETGLPLSSHATPDNVVLTRSNSIDTYSLLLMEAQPFSRRFVPWLIFSGVFERYPSLKLVLTELRHGPWIPVLLAEMDSAYYNESNRHIRTALPREPSDYWHENIYMGASFLADFEAHAAIADGSITRTMWGSDYPHIEGAWPNSKKSIQKTFQGIDPEVVKDVVGRTAMDVYGFDPAALQKVADRIGPSLAELTAPFEGRPADMEYSFAFRESGPWT